MDLGCFNTTLCLVIKQKGDGSHKKIKITVLHWPGNSSDLNPIKNLRSMIKLRLGSEDCTTKTKLIEAKIWIWYYDPDIKEKCQTLVDSMPNRVQ